MDDAVAVTQVVQHVRDVFILGAGEDVHVHALLAQVMGQLAHVDVHAAGVFAAKGRQGAGMIRKHGHIEHLILLFQVIAVIIALTPS